MRISKLTSTDDLSVRAWAQDVQRECNNYVHSYFVPVSTLGTGTSELHGKHSGKTLTAGQTAYMETVIPHSLIAFKEAGIRIIPSGTGTIDYTVNFSYGAVEDDENESTKTLAVTGTSVTDDQVAELDLPLSTFFTDLTQGDQLGIEIVLDALTTTTDIRILGFYLKYI